MPSGYDGKLIIICPRCKNERQMYAKGLCQSCYLASGKEKIICESCHRERTKYAKGMCTPCYKKVYFPPTDEQMEKHRERGAEYRQKNQDLINQKAREKYQNPEFKEQERVRKHNEYVAHKEKLSERIKRWIRGNPGYLAQKTQRRKARHAQVENTLTGAEWKQIVKESKGRCYYCHKKSKVFHQEHKLPVSRGGGYTKENIVAACPHCNSRKHTKTDAEFIELLKREGGG